MKLGKVSNYVWCLFQWTSIPYSTVQCQGNRPDTFRLEKSNKVNIFQFFRGHYFVVDLHLPLLELGLHAIQFIWQIFQCVSFEKALALKWFILDPMLISQNVFVKIVYIFLRFIYNFSDLLPTLKRIFALPTWCQIRTVFVLQPFEISFQTKQHVTSNWKINRYWNFFAFNLEKLNRIYSKTYENVCENCIHCKHHQIIPKSIIFIVSCAAIVW